MTDPIHIAASLGEVKDYISDADLTGTVDATGQICKTDGNASGSAVVPINKAPRLDLARRHVELLTGSPETYCHFRLLKGKGAGWNFSGTIDGRWHFIVEKQQEGWEVFIIVNDGGDSDAQITTIRALFADGDNIPTPVEWHAEPDFLTRRDATHWHAYWLVADMPKSDFRMAQKRLAAHYRTDGKVCNPSRVMRLAGTLHLKNAAHPYLITVESDDVVRYPSEARTTAELMAGLPEATATVTRALAAPEGVELDDEWNVSRARSYLKSVYEQQGPWGQDDPPETYAIAAQVKDLGCSETMTVDLLMEEHISESERDFIERQVHNAFEYGQNGAGCKASDAGRIWGKLAAKAAEEQVAPLAEISDSVPASDDALATEFADGNRGQLVWADGWNRWMGFAGGRWVECPTPLVWGRVRELAKIVADRMATADNTLGLRRQLLSKTKIHGVETLARGDLLVAASRFDAEPWLLNTPGGIVDLHTGDLSASLPEAYCTKMTAVAPAPMPTPRWDRFLVEITSGDRELQKYLQRVAGYCLTGAASEHAMFFCYGTGGNGKGVFLAALMGAFADYAKVAPIDTFTETKNDRHPTDMAMLQGARLVTAQETDEGRAWAEAKIKSLTGGDPVTARFMHKDFFTYMPQFKLLIAGNHKPRLRNVDEAMRRRLHMVPFTVTIASEKRDPNLPEKLKEEWPGILQWAIDGCLEWQRVGLSPAAVTDMTAGYFAEQDPLSAWIEECCDITDKSAWASIADLYGSYLTHAHAAGESVEYKERFSARLESRGFAKQRRICGRGFWGIKIRPEGNDAWGDL
jgi:putative DNA primase/helicase